MQKHVLSKMGRRARDRMVVGFTITCTITAYHCQRVSSILNHITEILLKVALTTITLTLLTKTFKI